MRQAPVCTTRREATPVMEMAPTFSAYAVDPDVVPSSPATTQHSASTARARLMTSGGGCGAPPNRAAAK